MESIESKILIVRKYIYQKKGVDIKDIRVSTHQDIMKLDWAVNFIKNQR